MQTLKQEALEAISKLPETASLVGTPGQVGQVPCPNTKWENC